MSRPLRSVVLVAMVFSAGLRALAADAGLPYATEPAFPLKFEQPVAIVSPPGETNRLFVVEKPGRIIVISDFAKPTRKVFLDLAARVGDDDNEQGVLALAFHPDYAKNRQFYIWWTSTEGDARENRLSRFLVSATDPNRADPASEQPLLAQVDDAPNHNGGELAFGPDGYLYLSLGDEGGANDQYRNSQRLDRDFFAGILRLDVDKRPGSLAPNPHPAVRAGSYTIPADNPFVGITTFNGRPLDPARVRTEFWAVGLRNPWRMSFDPATGRLWCADVGQNDLEEINLITRGGNYGWNIREGNSPFRRNFSPPDAKFTGPIWEYPHSQGISVTGGLVYHGDRHSDLKDKYIFADYGLGRIWALTPDGDNVVTADRVRTIAQEPGVVSFGRDPRNGDLLIASLYRSNLLRLVRTPPAAK
ncbi:MAG TPA: PQQ-dependent sugar dehydrogenase [Opitutaceae bacterium]|nr:PQQ-dependent sugar dehydrogenase [Opitutaceae bacterium]